MTQQWTAIKTLFAQVLTDFFAFVRRPTDEQLSLPFKEKCKVLFVIYIFEWFLYFLLVLPLESLIYYFMPLQNSYIKEGDTWQIIIFFSLIFAPVVEELIFRSPLRYRRIYNKLFSKRAWNKFFPFLLYLSAMSFGLLHIINYDNQSIWLYILAPFIILSQAVGGLTIGFIRVRLNFFWGVAYHSLWNLTLFLCYIILVALDTGYVMHEKDYTLEVYEQAFYEEDKPQGLYLTYDSAHQDNIKDLSVDQHTFNYVINEIYGEGNYYADEDFFVNIDFHSDKGLNKYELLEVLQEHYDIDKIKDE